MNTLQNKRKSVKKPKFRKRDVRLLAQVLFFSEPVCEALIDVGLGRFSGRELAEHLLSLRGTK